MAVLGSMLLDNECAGEVLQLLQPDNFYSRANQLIFQIIVELFDQRKAADLVILREVLTKRKLLEEIGGLSYLTSVIEAVPSAANALHYAEIVRQRAVLRKLITVSNEIQRDAYASSQEVPVLLDQAEKLIFEVAEKDTRGTTVEIKTVLHQVFDRIDRVHDRKGRLTGISSGFYSLDDLTCGFQNGELIILAARPSVGKTTLALNIAEHVAVEGQLPVAIFSLEMSSQQLAQNMLCSRARVNAHLLRRGILPESDNAKLVIAVGKLSEAPIFIDETAGITTLQLRTKARRLKAQYDIRLLIIDYVQLIESESFRRADNRQTEISDISRGIKALARELEIPILMISQLNRAVEGRDDHRPRMSDLRESGALEQDADVVLLLHRASYYDPQEDRGKAQLIIAKQRNGPTGQVDLAFLSEYLRFENLAARQEPS
jgi:replicative DNA helicase